MHAGRLSSWSLVVPYSLIAIALAVLPARGSAFIQQATNTTSNSTTLTVTLPSNPQAGDALILTIADPNSAGVSSISGGGITNWVRAASAGAHVNVEIWYGLNSSGSGTSIVVTTGATGPISANVSEFTGITGVDTSKTSNDVSTNVTAGPVSPTVAPDLLIGAAAINGTSISSGPTSGFTALNAANNSSGTALLEAGYFASTSLSSVSVGWTLPASTGWDAALVAFKSSNLVQQSTNSATNSTSVTVSLSANPQPGDALVLTIVNDATGVSGVSGGGIATWTEATSSCNHECVAIWYGLGSSGSGSSITATLQGAANVSANVAEFYGVGGLDGSTTSNGTTASITTQTLTTANPADLIIAMGGIEGNTGISSGPTNSFAALGAQANGSSGPLLEPAYRIVAETGSYSTGWTVPVADGWDTATIALSLNLLSQQISGTASGTSTLVLTLPSNPSPGDALVVTSANDTTGIQSISGGGVTWTTGTSTCPHICSDIWYGLNSSGSGQTITINYGQSGNAAANVAEFAGIASTNALDATSTNEGVSTSVGSGTINTSSNAELVIGAAAINGSSISSGPTNSFTSFSPADNTGHALLAGAFDWQCVSGSNSTSWTLSSTTGWDSGIISLKASGGPCGGGGGGNPSYYGTGVNTETLSNLIMNGSNLWWDYWFVASDSGKISTLRTYFESKTNVEDPMCLQPCYGGGSMAIVEINIYPDNGSGKPDLSQASLGGVSSYQIQPDGDFSKLPVTWADPNKTITKGQKYHIVYQNIDGQPTKDYSSLDGWGEVLACPRNLTFTETMFGDWQSNDSGSTWDYHDGNVCDLPIIDIGYDDSSHEGIGWYELGQGSGGIQPIDGSGKEVREKFILSGTQTVTSASVYVHKGTGSDPETLNIALEDSSGGVLAQGSAPVDGTLTQYRTVSFGSSGVSLSSGTYYLVLSSSSTAYSAWPMVNGSVYFLAPNNDSFDPATVIDGTAHTAQYCSTSCTNQGNWSGIWWPNSGGDYTADLMFFLTLR